MVSSTQPRAFSLIELLVVISIVTLLVSILLPALGKARDVARSVQCMSNARQMTLALAAYTHDFHGSYVTHRYDTDEGAYWWFGLEPGGAGIGQNRPLDKTRSPLAPYFGGGIQLGLQCPDFPRFDVLFYPKFEIPSAHYGYNGGIVWPSPVAAKPRRVDEVLQPSRVFSFADAIHQDRPDRFYEPHEVALRKPGLLTGTAHFRHGGRANVAMLDGHVAVKEPVGPDWGTIAGSPIANLDIDDGADSIYGFNTWTSP